MWQLLHVSCIKRFRGNNGKVDSGMREYKPVSKARRNLRVFILFIISLIFVGIAAAIAVIGCNYVENQQFRETFYSTNSLKVNNKIRVIQISDLHNCSYGDNNSEIIDRVGKLAPDLIIFTGDCIDADLGTDQAVSLCAALSKIAPSYYIYGNNEVEKYYNAALTQDYLDATFGFHDGNRDPQKLLDVADSFAQSLEAVGVKVLKNSMDTITVGETKVDVYGVLTSNPSAFWSYAGESFNDYLYTNEGNLKITAIHEPQIFEEYSPDYWGDLMLAGHTHGGTVRVPVLGPLYTQEGGLLPQRSGAYVYGRTDVQGRPLIVSSGLENTNIFRINNQPEIVVVDINKF